MAFFWHGHSASVRFQNPPKAFKTLRKPSKHLERDPTLDVTLVCDSHDDRFLQTAQISLKRCRFPYISLKRLKLLMISLKAWWFPSNVDDFLKNTPALRARGLHTRSRWSSVISKRNQTKTFDLMAFFWHGHSASVRFQNPPKAFKTLRKPSKHLERDPTLDVTLVCDSHDDRFLQTAQISLKRCRFPYISLKRLKLLMISLKAWWFP